MIISDKFVYMDLQKTGCTYIRHLLKDLLGCEFAGKHNIARPELFNGKRTFLSSIRNPWTWYLSLWAFGCDNKGNIYHKATKPFQKYKLRGRGWRTNPFRTMQSYIALYSKNTEKWKRTYQNVEDPLAFQDWLYMMNDEEYWHDFEGYGTSSISDFAGLFTYRYIRLCCCTSKKLPLLNSIRALDELTVFEKEMVFIDHFIRNESLEHDLFKTLGTVGIEISREKKYEIMSRPKINTSSWKHEPEYYYNSKTERLVYDREQLIIDKFNYVFPSIE